MREHRLLLHFHRRVPFSASAGSADRGGDGEGLPGGPSGAGAGDLQRVPGAGSGVLPATAGAGQGRVSLRCPNRQGTGGSEACKPRARVLSWRGQGGKGRGRCIIRSWIPSCAWPRRAASPGQRSSCISRRRR